LLIFLFPAIFPLSINFIEMSSFKINQNKIFLNNSSFLRHDQPLDDYIIDHNLNSLLLDSSSHSPNTSKISSSALYSHALKYKNTINTELIKSKQKTKEKDISNFTESMGLLQIPLTSNKKNPIINPNEEVSFLTFEEIEKHNIDLIPKENHSLSLPKLHHKYQILKDSYQGLTKSIKMQTAPINNGLNNKMIFDIEVTHNKEMFQGLSKKIKQDRIESFNNLQNNINENKKVMIKMPPIRSYPMIKINKITFKTKNELEDLESKDQNTTITSGINANTIKTDESSKNTKYRVYWDLGEIYTWKPEVRESASFILDGHRGILYGGLGTKVLDDVVSIDFGRNH